MNGVELVKNPESAERRGWIFDAARTIWHRTPFVRPAFWGLFRAAWRLRERLGRLRYPDHDVEADCHGKRLILRSPRQSVITRSILETGIWEPEETRFVASRITPGMTVLDVGGDVGYYTLLFAIRVGPAGRVFVFEPMPQVKAYLDRNIALNQLTNVTSIDFALSDKPGTVILEAPFKKSRLNLNKQIAESDDVEVEMKTYDDWQAEAAVGRIDLVKIDVEGAEMNVLLGMQAALRRFHPALLIEVHPIFIRQFGHSASELVQFLAGLGYHVEPVDSPEIHWGDDNITIYCS